MEIGNLLSFVDLKLVNSNIDPIEFYNKCHGEDGKFCEGEAGISGNATIEDVYSDLPDFRNGEDPEYDQRDALWEAANETLRRPELREWDENKGYKDHLNTGATFLVNRVLREKLTEIDTPDAMESAKEDIATLDAMFAEKSFSTDGHYLFRGVGPLESVTNLRPGDIFQDDGYLSTSTDSRGGMDYLDSEPGNGASMWQIKTKQDTRALPGLTPGGVHEVLLNRSLPLKVNTIASDIQSRNLIIDAEVV